MDLDQLYKSGISVSHAHGLDLVWAAGYQQALDDSKAAQGQPETLVIENTVEAMPENVTSDVAAQ